MSRLESNDTRSSDIVGDYQVSKDCLAAGTTSACHLAGKRKRYITQVAPKTPNEPFPNRPGANENSSQPAISDDGQRNAMDTTFLVMTKNQFTVAQ